MGRNLDSSHLDPAHKADAWAFYGFDNMVSAKIIDRPASCYTCHEQQGAVDTTFTQFYPNLQKAAETHHSFSPAYLKETAAK